MEHITSLVARYPPHEEHEDVWGESRLRVGEHLASELPPDELITSVRAVVLVGAQVLVVHDPHALHILPGGRREPGETLLATLRREVLEETGWELGEPTRLGFRHLCHLTPRPPAYRYPSLPLIFPSRLRRARPPLSPRGPQG